MHLVGFHWGGGILFFIEWSEFVWGGYYFIKYLLTASRDKNGSMSMKPAIGKKISHIHKMVFSVSVLKTAVVARL